MIPESGRIRRYTSLPESLFAPIRPTGVHGGTSWLAWWQIGVGRNPVGIFDVEKCEQRTVSLPTLDSTRVLPSHSGAIPVAILLYCILTHGFHIWNQTFDWFSSRTEYCPLLLLLVRHTTFHRDGVLSSWQALFLHMKPLPYIRQRGNVDERTERP